MTCPHGVGNGVFALAVMVLTGTEVYLAGMKIVNAGGVVIAVQMTGIIVGVLEMQGTTHQIKTVKA